MFLHLAGWLSGGVTVTGENAECVLRLNSGELAQRLQEVWSKLDYVIDTSGSASTPSVRPMHDSGSKDLPEIVCRLPHLIYAYMIENTRVYEVFARVLREHLHGERLAVASTPAARNWLRATEDLFYKDPPPFQIQSLTSWIRPDLRASRRNAYYRMFGMDLNHGTEANQAYPFEKPSASNREFVPTFEEFLREVWTGVENSRNVSGPNATDDAAIATLARRLKEMLQQRRINHNLHREEFAFVAVMSWFHLTLLFDTPIVTDLKAEGPSPAERLRKIGERVGLPPHARSDSYFRLAEPMSTLLLAIEKWDWNATTAAALYNPGAPRSLFQDVTEIINQWSIATGRSIKAKRVSVSPTVGPSALVPSP